MFEIIVSAYILGLVFFGGLWGMAAWKMGGWQGYADFVNGFFQRAGSKEAVSPNSLQWRVVIYTLLWPVVIPAVCLLFWLLKKNS